MDMQYNKATDSFDFPYLILFTALIVDWISFGCIWLSYIVKLTHIIKKFNTALPGVDLAYSNFHSKAVCLKKYGKYLFSSNFEISLTKITSGIFFLLVLLMYVIFFFGFRDMPYHWGVPLEQK